MFKFLETVKLVASLYPILLQTVKALEEALPEAGNGQVKLEMLKATLQGAYENIENAKVRFDEIWPSINLVVSTIVSLYNTLGLFKKK